MNQQQITKTLEMQEVILTSLSCLAYLRNFFEEKCFINTTFCGVSIKQLKRGNSTESDRFLDWLERGVFDALHHKYLKSLVFGIYLDESLPTKVSETYTYDFTYDHDSVNNTESVSKLIRTLCTLTQTLQPLPNIKYLTLKLFYNKTTPIDYEPPMFRKASNHTFGYISEPLKLNVGKTVVNRCETLLKISTVYDTLKNSKQEPKKMKPNTKKSKKVDVEKKEEIKCVCNVNISDGDMLQCDKCVTWLHTICCGFFSNDDKRIPSGEYVCDLCLGIESKETLRMVAYERKVLSAIYNENYKDETALNIRLGINTVIIRSILVKFEREGFMRINGAGYDVIKSEDIKEKIKTYFSINVFDEKSSLPIDDIKCVKR